jgi:hypothetical protein
LVHAVAVKLAVLGLGYRMPRRSAGQQGEALAAQQYRHAQQIVDLLGSEVKLSDLLQEKLLEWLRTRGVHAVSATVDEMIENDYGNYRIETYVYYRLPNGDQGSEYYAGPLTSLIDQLDSVGDGS